MDLQQLKFTVDTSQLKDAVSAIKNLNAEVNKMSKPASEMKKATKEVSDETKKSVSVLERQKDILGFMADGFSKGQASVMAYAKAAGALSSDMQTLGEVLKTQRKLMGTDPFDKSIGAMQALANEYTVTKEVQRLFNAELGLSKSQMTDLAKEKLRLIEKLKLEGATLTQVKNGLMELNAAYIKNASAENNINKAMEDKQKAAAATSKANQYIINEMERVNRLTSENGTLTSATNNKLITFEKALRASGMSAAEQAKKLDDYKKSLMSVQKQAGNRQVDYLSRALGPQITDIFTGLATGQNPMTVLLQQGGQLRDQFALAGVAGKDMGNMLTASAKAMLVSIKDVALAVGGLFTSAVAGAGKSILNFFTAVPKAMLDMVTMTGNATAAMDQLKLATLSMMKTGIVALIAGVVAVGVEMYRTSKANEEMTKNLLFYGASMGITADGAKAMAESIGATGKSTLGAIQAIGEFAKAGAQADEQAIALGMDLEKYTGKSVADTAKEFAKLKDEPTKALIDLAKNTGLVSKATLDQVHALEESGNKAEAARIATQAWKDANKQALNDFKGAMAPIDKLWVSIKSGIAGAMNEVYNFANSKNAIMVMSSVWKVLATTISAVWYTAKDMFNGLIAGAKMAGLALTGQFSEAWKVGQEWAKSSEENGLAFNSYVEELWKGDEATKSLTQTEATRRKQAATDASQATDRWKLEKEALNAYNSILQQANAEYLKQAGVVTQLTAAEEALNKVRSTENWKKLTKAQQEQIVAIYQASAAIEQQNETNKSRAKYLELIASLTGKNDKMGSDYYTRLNELNDMQFKGAISAEEYANALNALYKTTSSYKALEGVQGAVAKSVADIKAQRDALSSSYSTDFLTADQKAAIDAQSKYAKSVAESDAEYKKNVSDAERTMNAADAKAAIASYKEKHDQQVALAQDVKDREEYLLSDSYKRTKAYSDAFKGLFDGMADALVTFAQTGKLNFSGLINSMIADLAKFEMRKAMTGVYEGLGGGKGIFSAITSLFANADGNAFGQAGSVIPFAKGGSFTNSVVSSPTLFKFAKGTGLMGEAGPEAIMPLKRGADGSLGVQSSGGSSNVQVNVINNSNVQATTSETTDSRGNRKIEVMIGDMAAGEISRSGSAAQKSIKSTFGMQPQLIRR